MATTLSEFLQQKAEGLQAQAAKNRESINEWREAVGNLFAGLVAWIKDADPSGLIRVDETRTEIYEPGLGPYDAPQLVIRALGTRITITPTDRLTVSTIRQSRSADPERTAGRVELTDGVTRHSFYRLADGSGGWFVVSTGAAPQPLTRQTFEQVLLSYLL